MRCFPLDKDVHYASDPLSFKTRDFKKETELPVGAHPGAFGAVRKHHRHEGVDLYCEPWDPVYAIEDGVVVLIEDFTGPQAGSPWWHDTRAIHIEGASGVFVYGEVSEVASLRMGDRIKRGDHLAFVRTVLKEDKGRPMTMLHLELYAHGHRGSVEWKSDAPRPQGLNDPTPFLIECHGKDFFL